MIVIEEINNYSFLQLLIEESNKILSTNGTILIKNLRPLSSFDYKPNDYENLWKIIPIIRNNNDFDISVGDFDK